MRYLKGLVAVTAIALVVAACTTTDSEFNVDPQAFINPPIFAPDINWDVSDGYHVDVYGMGMGDDAEVTNNPATIVIPDPGNVVMIRMQVQIKGGPDDFPYTQPTSVDFATDGGESVSVSTENTGVGTDGYFTTNFGWHYNASFDFTGNATEVTATVYENALEADDPCAAQCTPRAFKVWVFRTPDASNPANSGGLYQDDLWWGTKGSATPFPRFTNTHSLNIPAAAGPRDVTVEVAFSDLANDGRTAQVDIAADGLSASEIYDNTSPGYERESLIASLTLPDVPGGVTSVDITFTSPDGTDVDNASVDGGDSFFVSGAAVTAGPIDLSFGRFTGGINVDAGEFNVTGGLTLHCDILLSNNLEINWEDGGQNRWHIRKESLTDVVCSDDPNIEQRPPRAPLDTLMAEAVGKLTYDGLRNAEGSVIRFTIVDAGEPGRNDTIDIQIWAPGDDPDNDLPILDVQGSMERGGNLQAHYDQPHGNKP